MGAWSIVLSMLNSGEGPNFLSCYKIMSYLGFFLRFYLFIFRERGRERERKGEKHHCVVASYMPPTGDLACNPGMCPDGELNR